MLHEDNEMSQLNMFLGSSLRFVPKHCLGAIHRRITITVLKNDDG